MFFIAVIVVVTRKLLLLLFVDYLLLLVFVIELCVFAYSLICKICKRRYGHPLQHSYQPEPSLTWRVVVLISSQITPSSIASSVTGSSVSVLTDSISAFAFL